MQIRNSLLAALCLFLLAACSSGIPASKIKNLSDYVDGVAVAETYDGCVYFVDTDLVPLDSKTHYIKLGDWIDGYALALSETPNGDLRVRHNHIVNRRGESVVKQDYTDDPVLLPGGRAWVKTPDGISLRKLDTGETLLDETAWVHSHTPAGTSVLAHYRNNRHPDGYEYATLIEFMVVDADGSIIVPWGRIGYIGEFSHGLAVASNSVQGWLSSSHAGNIQRFSRSSLRPGKYGYIDERGQWIIPETFYNAGNFNEEGFAEVLTREIKVFDRQKPSYINREGRVLSGSEADHARRTLENDRK